MNYLNESNVRCNANRGLYLTDYCLFSSCSLLVLVLTISSRFGWFGCLTVEIAKIQATQSRKWYDLLSFYAGNENHVGGLLFLSAGMGSLKGGRDWGGESVLPKVSGAMDQEYERRLLRQINHQNLPEGHLPKVSRVDVCYPWCYRLSL